jgi:hypothetical protein
MESFRLEWQPLSTDLCGKPTFKVVLLGAYKQAEELLYTVSFLFVFFIDFIFHLPFEKEKYLLK